MTYTRKYLPRGEREERITAAKIRDALADAVKAINDREDLSHEGKRQKLAQVTQAAQASLSDLQRKDAQVLADRQAELTDGLFTPRGSSSVMERRDAAERAARITTVQHARELARVAHELDDSTLAQAVARRAHSLAMETVIDSEREGYGGVAIAYADSVTSGMDRLIELAAIDRESTDPMARVESSALFTATVPDAVRPGEVPALAAQADHADATANTPPVDGGVGNAEVRRLAGR